MRRVVLTIQQSTTTVVATTKYYVIYKTVRNRGNAKPLKNSK